MMKGVFLCLVGCFLCAYVSHGQYYRQDRGLLLGVNAGYVFPTGDLGKLVKQGLGGNVSVKYLINEVIGIGFESGYYNFKTKLNLDNENVAQGYKYHLIPALLEATFYIPTWNRTTLPYLGVQFGGYLNQIRVTREGDSYASIPSLSKKLNLFAPGGGVQAGVLFQLASDRFWMDLKVKADYVANIEDEYDLDEYTKGNIGFDKLLNIGVNIGVLYKF